MAGLHRGCVLPQEAQDVWGALVVKFTPFDVQSLDRLAHQDLQIDAVLVQSVPFYVLVRIFLYRKDAPSFGFGYPVGQFAWKAE